jgi:CDP-glucose 4,6-dehydratase
MVRLWGEDASWQVVSQQNVHEAHLLRLDSSKARTALHWRPRWTLDQTLAKTVQWYREFYQDPRPNAVSMRKFTLRQIDAYVSDRESTAAKSIAP